MSTQIVEIQPRELKFILDLKKSSSCAVHLANVTDHYVAFKVKTTSPKKYCVRPNVGIIMPKSTCDFTVTMQPQKSASSDMNCKDKFLIQSTVVAFGATEEDITPNMFMKDGHKYIEETKLRVILTSAPNSPVKIPSDDAALEQESSHEKLTPKETHLPGFPSNNGTIKQEHPSHDTAVASDKFYNQAETILSSEMVYAKPEVTKNGNDMEESKSLGFMNGMKPVRARDEVFFAKRDEVTKQLKDTEEENLKLTKALEDMKLKVSIFSDKLVEAERTINKLKEPGNGANGEKETLKLESAMTTTRTSSGSIIVRDGFPPLFVCIVALLGLMIGSFFRA